MPNDFDDNEETKRKLKEWLDEQEIEPDQSPTTEATVPEKPAKNKKPAPLSMSEQLDDGLAKLALGVTIGLGSFLAGIQFGLRGVIVVALGVAPIAHAVFRLLSWAIFYFVFRSGRPLKIQKLKPKLW